MGLLLGLLSALTAAPARAQETSNPSESTTTNEEITEITVTGTRLAHYIAPTPVTTISTEELQAKAARDVASLVEDLPALRPNFNTGQVSAPIGASYLDLRSLGPNRTLLLVDGRRFGATDNTGGADINILPAILIKRIEIVTGGASAAYGSDAVSGVVNLFLDNEFEGLKADAQYGISQYQDARQPAASVAFGKAFIDGRLHVVGAVDYTHDSGELNQDSRPWGRNNVGILINPAYKPGNGQPQRLILPNSLLSQMTYGGVTSVSSIPALRGLQFLPGGVVAPFAYGTNVGSTFMTGGGGISVMPYANILPELDRRSAYSHVTYDLTDTTKVFVDALWSHGTAYADQLNNFDTGNLTLHNDNAFLPLQIKNILAANKLSTFQIGRLDTEAGVFATHVLTQVQRYSVGIQGSLFGSWTWDAYAQFGHNNYDRDDYNNRITANYLNAVDAVISPTTGQAVCRSTLTHPNNGCVAANVFGQGSISAAAVAYYTGTSWVDQRQEQNVYAAKVNGTPFDTWAGSASTALGGEFRKESLDVAVDPISAASGWKQINAQPIKGSYTVKEGFAEIGIPLAKNNLLAHLLDVDGAVRQTDYSTSGNVTTWKAGLNYEPIADVRLRGTVSRDIRAPILNELYSGQNQGISPLIDPVNNTQRSITQLTGGNPRLVPERALTRTLGLVYQPAWVQGAHLSVDYYSINLTNAITTLTAQQVLDGCYKLNQQTLCNQITRDGAGNISLVQATLLNASAMRTYGVDYEAGYSRELLAGQFSVRALATYVGELATTLNGVVTDRAGQVGATGGTPHWTGNVFVNYATHKWGAGVLYRYVEGGTYDNTYVQGVDINNNHVGGRSYFDLNGSYKLSDSLEIFGKVNNVCNIAPPATPQTVSQALYAGSAYYDRIGRYYILGVRIRL